MDNDILVKLDQAETVIVLHYFITQQKDTFPRVQRSVYWTRTGLLGSYGLNTGVTTDLCFPVGVNFGFLNLVPRPCLNASSLRDKDNVTPESVRGQWRRNVLE